MKRLTLDSVLPVILKERNIAPQHLASILKDVEASFVKHKKKTDFLKYSVSCVANKCLNTSPLLSVKKFFTGGYDESLVTFFAGQKLKPLTSGYGGVCLYKMKKGVSGSPKEAFYSLGKSLSSLHLPQNLLVQILTQDKFLSLRQKIFTSGKSFHCVMTNQNGHHFTEQEHCYAVVTLTSNEDGPQIYMNEFGFRTSLKGGSNNQILVMEK